MIANPQSTAAEDPVQAEPVLRLDRVSKIYHGGSHALRDASLEVRPGEFIVIVGPSGAGKSTLLRSINFLVRPTSGRVFIAGKEVTGESGSQLRDIRSKVGMIFQQFGLVGRLTVLQNVLAGRLRFHAPTGPFAARTAAAARWAVLLGLLIVPATMAVDAPRWITLTLAGSIGAIVALFGVIWSIKSLPSILRIFPASDRQIAAEALRAVGISHLADRRADRLSGGQQQRVAIARVLAQQPQVVLADEPIASLDPVSAIAVMDALQTINHSHGIPVVVNLHQVDIAKRYATRIIGMSAGRIIFDGPVQDLTTETIERIYRTQPQAPRPEPRTIRRRNKQPKPATTPPTAAATGA
jgi:phosphonate transport system ATP-binding protein